jgi:hypothetical protein
VTGPGGSQILLEDPAGNLVELFSRPAADRARLVAGKTLLRGLPLLSAIGKSLRICSYIVQAIGWNGVLLRGGG